MSNGILVFHRIRVVGLRIPMRGYETELAA